MDRVTDEWLDEVALIAGELADKQYPSRIGHQDEWTDALRLSFAQTVAWECVLLVNDEIQVCSAAVSITTTTEQARQNQNNILTRIDALRWTVAQISARFGLEE